MQWWIQDFPEGGELTPKSVVIFHFLGQNCMKMKEFGPPEGRVPGAPLGSANGMFIETKFYIFKNFNYPKKLLHSWNCFKFTFVVKLQL